jgi:hypothetical protein
LDTVFVSVLRVKSGEPPKYFLPLGRKIISADEVE